MWLRCLRTFSWPFSKYALWVSYDECVLESLGFARQTAKLWKACANVLKKKFDYEFAWICWQHHWLVSHDYEGLFSCKLNEVASSRVRYSKFVYRPLAELCCTQPGSRRLPIFPFSGTNHTKSSLWKAFHIPVSKDETGGNENICFFSSVLDICFWEDYELFVLLGAVQDSGLL